MTYQFRIDEKTTIEEMEKITTIPLSIELKGNLLQEVFKDKRIGEILSKWVASGGVHRIEMHDYNLDQQDITSLDELWRIIGGSKIATLIFTSNGIGKLLNDKSKRESFLTFLNNSGATELFFEREDIKLLSEDACEKFCATLAEMKGLSALSIIDDGLIGNFSPKNWEEFSTALKKIKLARLSLSRINEGQNESNFLEFCKFLENLTTTFLNLRNNGIGWLTPKQLEKFCAAVEKAAVVSWDFSANDLERLTANQLRRLLEALIKCGTIELNLRNTNFSNLSEVSLQDLCKLEPSLLKKSKLRSLSLEFNRLDTLSVTQLELLCKLVKMLGITKLILKNNRLFLSPEDMGEKFLEILPQLQLDFLYLYSNGFGGLMTDIFLGEFLAVSPRLQVKSLGIIDVDCVLRLGRDNRRWALLIKALNRSTITSLSLPGEFFLVDGSHSKYCSVMCDSLGTVIKNCPKITALDISNVKEVTGTALFVDPSALKQFVKVLINSHVTRINLSLNALYTLSEQDWKEFAESLKKTHVEHINFGDNGISQEMRFKIIEYFDKNCDNKPINVYFSTEQFENSSTPSYEFNFFGCPGSDNNGKGGNDFKEKSFDIQGDTEFYFP